VSADWWDRFRIGDQVRFTAGHPWEGFSGEVTRYMDTPIGRMPVVKIKSGDWGNWGRESCITRPRDAEVIA
jgi:hypothetical protein